MRPSASLATSRRLWSWLMLKPFPPNGWSSIHDRYTMQMSCSCSAVCLLLVCHCCFLRCECAWHWESVGWDRVRSSYWHRFPWCCASVHRICRRRMLLLVTASNPGCLLCCCFTMAIHDAPGNMEHCSAGRGCCDSCLQSCLLTSLYLLPDRCSDAASACCLFVSC